MIANKEHTTAILDREILRRLRLRAAKHPNRIVPLQGEHWERFVRSVATDDSEYDEVSNRLIALIHDSPEVRPVSDGENLIGVIVLPRKKRRSRLTAYDRQFLKDLLIRW